MKSIIHHVAILILVYGISLSSHAEPSFATQADDALGEAALLQAIKL